MSVWVKGFISTGKSLDRVLRTEKALINLSPDIKRYCKQREKIEANKKGFVPIYQRKVKKFLKKIEEKELENISFEQINWLDYVGK
jgi:hypothetical protein